MTLPSVSFKPIDPLLLPPVPAHLPRTSKRLVQLLSKGSATPDSDAQKSWSLDFFLSPKSFNTSKADVNHVSSVTFAKTVPNGPDMHDPSTRVYSSTETVPIKASLAFRSIGYKSEALEGMQDLGIDFDSIRGIIPNDGNGRIIKMDTENGTSIPGMYCSGWVKRGPAGVIANTMEDSFATAEAIAMDWTRELPFMAGGQGWDALKVEADQRNLRRVSWDEWKMIDAVEKKRGKANGKVREKFASIQDMLAVLD